MYVNGPVNTVRLEGSVGSVEKVVYLFMDYHMPDAQQGKCENIRAVDIDTFLVEEFDKLAKTKPTQTYDFMFERGPTRPYHSKKIRGKYLHQVAKLFTESFKIDLDVNKAQRSELVPNVRFHYVDVRDFVAKNNFIAYYEHIAPVLNVIDYNKSYNIGQLNDLFHNIQSMQYNYSMLYVLLYKNNNLFNPKMEKSLYSAYEYKMNIISEEDNYKLIQKFIHKLLSRYENKNIQKIIQKIIDTELHEMFIDLFNYLDIILTFINKEIDMLKKFGENSSTKILFQQSDGSYNYGIDHLEHLDKILKFSDISRILFDKYINIGVYLMDLYLIQRILDKNYITNSIAYTGASHSENYIRLLVKYFGFKITHYSYLKDNDIKKAEKIINNSKNMQELAVLFSPIIFTQCSNLDSFPKLFD